MVFAFCTFAWIFFVSNSIGDAFYVVGNCLVGISSPIAYFRDGFVNIGNVGFGKGRLVIAGMCILIMAGYDYLSLKEDFISWFSKKNKSLQWAFYIVIGLMVVFLSQKGVATEFIYFQF